MIVAAHPDDETIGASTLLPGAVSLVHVTDGAPRNMADAHRCGFQSRKEYAEARRKELLEALQICGTEASVTCLGIPDQEATYNIEYAAGELAREMERVRPQVVLTHPYEGGHPDHDAIALAVQIASQDRRVPVWEFAAYHNRNGSICTNEFLPADEVPVHAVDLRGLQKLQKQRMLECFRTQQETLQCFGLAQEKFRPAPQYDFTQPPHAGTLFYELFDWGMTGDRFRQIASEALAVC